MHSSQMLAVNRPRGRLARFQASTLVALACAVAPWTRASESSSPAEAGPGPAAIEGYKAVADRLIDAATKSSFAFERLTTLCDEFGPRFSGSTNLEAAIDWLLAEMKSDGLDNVRGEDVMVPCWLRGRESLEMVLPRSQPLKVLGIGGSVGTPPEGITAEVLVVKDLLDLTNRAPMARGKIVLFNQPWTGYGNAVAIRVRGASRAAQAGAVASLARSATPFSIQSLHTGMLRYEEGAPRIPHAATTPETADMLQRMQDRGQRVALRLGMEARSMPEVRSRNVIAEVRGREKPHEIVVVGGHIDSWDVSPGAMDDAGGCVAAWEAARLLLKLEMRPRRTVRVVLWTNEENGLRGSRTYRTNHLGELSNHVLAIEADLGVFKPTGFTLAGSNEAMNWVRQISGLFERIQATEVNRGSGGADLWALAEEGVPTMELSAAGDRYFWYHHTEADTLDKLNRDEFNQCVAALAVMAYVVADLPDRLPW